MRPRVGCGHAGTGAVAVPSMSYETAAVLYRDTFVSMNRMSVKTVSYTGYSKTFSNDAIVRVPHAQGSKPHPLTALPHHLARGNHFTAGRTFESMSLTLNQFEFTVGYRLSTQSFLCAYPARRNVFLSDA